MKKTILVALAGVALLAAPLSAEARPGGGGGFHGGGGAHGAGGYRGGGGFHGAGGYRGGYRGGYGGYHRGYGYGYGGWALGAAGLGFVAGAALADQSYWDGYGDYGYYGPAYPPVVDPGYAYPLPPQSAGPPPVACGQWVWEPAASRYNWVPGPCAAPAY